VTIATIPPLLLYDDVQARQFAPFSLTRPLAAIRAGAELIGRRWGDAFDAAQPLALSSPHLTTFREAGAPGESPGVLRPGTIVANSRCVIALDARAGAGGAWRVGDDVAAVRLAKPLPAEALRDGSLELATLASRSTDFHTLRGRWLEAPWDLIGQLPEQLLEDAATLAARLADTGIPGGERIGTHPIVVEQGVVVEPYVVLDATLGAIVIRAPAHICAFTRIAGPCVIGAGTQILGGRISGSSVGEECRIHGDLSASIFIGHGNKAHEGFVGHSVVGRWANLGAGTTTSNLKNSYGPVRMWTPTGERDSGLTFLGALIGDHAKLGIGTMLGTGTVVGTGANVFGTMRPAKRIPPFAWGDAPPYETFSLPKFLDVAERVMSRRNVPLDPDQRALLSSAYALAGTDDW
jgi:UDP-N-acetylglucosamine diphosphorylase/glucosamine-1-phosphate N-acetyltransferase